jgi:hypothetical protein
MWNVDRQTKGKEELCDCLLTGKDAMISQGIQRNDIVLNWSASSGLLDLFFSEQNCSCL